MGLRERNRLAAMRATQHVALRRFLDEGFEPVTVESIAAEAGMAASTVFRHFGTKENLVLWDEHEVELDRILARRIGLDPPLVALRDSFKEGLAERYGNELEFQLQRVRFIYATEALHAAAVEADHEARLALSAALSKTLSKRHRESAVMLAGAALLALDVAIDRWQSGNAAEPLEDCIDVTFRDLARLDLIA